MQGPSHGPAAAPEWAEDRPARPFAPGPPPFAGRFQRALKARQKTI